MMSRMLPKYTRVLAQYINWNRFVKLQCENFKVIMQMVVNFEVKISKVNIQNGFSSDVISDKFM